MRVWRELYGDNADGNMGVMVDMYEVEDSDKEEIIELLYPYYAEQNIIKGLITITYEELDIEVEISDYEEELLEKYFCENNEDDVK